MEDKPIKELQFLYGQSMDSVWKELVIKINEIIIKVNFLFSMKELEDERKIRNKT
jgi:hypothetical protein